MKHSYKSANLSVSSTSSTSSASSLSPGLSPRKGLLSPSDYYLLSPSPPPSPGLPSLIPRHGKKPAKRGYRRLLLTFAAVTVLAWLGFNTLSVTHESPQGPSGQYEIVSDDSLPEEPSVVVVSDERGKKKWTVSIPAHHAFPLLPSQYHEICQQAEHISMDIDGTGKKGMRKRGLSYYQADPKYVDVGEAQQRGLLPDPNKEGKIADQKTPDDPSEGRRPCSKSLTYVMETADAGMGDSLLGLWMAYGLAQKEGRAFFVDDTRWPYGNYSTYFTPAPHPNCMPAPEFQRVPCPHSAHHLVVSSATFPRTFGPSFTSTFSNSKKQQPQRDERIFGLLRTGYEALFHLADEGDAQYVLQRTEKDFGRARDGGGMNVGLHVRRGDLHPWEYQYEKDYLPLTRYMDEVREILISKYEHEDIDKNLGHEDEEVDEEADDGEIHINPHIPEEANAASDRPDEPKPPKRFLYRRHGAPGIAASDLFLASDDPDVYSAPEVSRAQRAQTRIVLATKSQLEASIGSKKNPWVDEIHGWEGGFYRDQFFGLGKDDKDRGKFLGKWKSSITSEKGSGVMLEDENPDFLDPPSEAAMQMRQMVGRAYLLDLAVLGQSDAVVCAVSASTCRILAVMMGWEKAVVQRLWRNVDGGFAWRGLVVPED